MARASPAKAAASLDLLSAGRIQLGLGSGFQWDGIEAMGGPRRSPGEALQALEEAIDVIRAVWSGEENVQVSGKFYRLQDATCGPRPSSGLGIWVGAYGPVGMNGFAYWLDDDRENQIKRFAEEVVPEVKARLSS